MADTIRSTRDIISDSRVVKFRQSLNLFSKNWTRVKIYDPKVRKFVPIDMELTKKTITKKYGFCMLIYQVRSLFIKKKDSNGRPMWSATEVSKGRVTYSGTEYGTYDFSCIRQRHDISGVM